MVVEEGQATRLIGAPIRRVEDPPLLTGRGQFLDDLVLPRMLEGAVLRSPYAHARIIGIDTSAARALPGVVDVITGADLVGVVGPQPVIWRMLPNQRDTNQLALATERVRYAGQGVAAVVASDRYVAEDALALIEVDYEALPVAASLEAALAPGAPRLYDEWPDNLVGGAAFVKGDYAAAEKAAAVVVRQRFSLGRMAGMPMETRGVVASWDPFTGEIDLWLSTQSPNLARDLLGEVLGLPIHKIRVRVPDVGGGFGNKFDFYGEEVLACLLSRRTGRPVKIVEDRLESFTATVQSREVVTEAAMAFAADGTIVGLQGEVFGVLGGCVGTVGAGPAWTATALMTGPYKVPNADLKVTAVATNRAPMGSFRGWGQPEGNFVCERLIELGARRLGLDRNEVRRRNLPAPEEFPFVTGVVFVYDSGRYEQCLDLCLSGLEERGWWKRQAAARDEGRTVGIGFGFHVEITSFGPSRLLNYAGLTHSGFEEAVVRMDATGRVTAFTGQCAMGQGLETALAQVTADTMGVPFEDVVVVSGDTATCPFTGYGTGGSSGASMGGGTLLRAATRLRDKVRSIAAHLLEANVDDVTVADGRCFVKGSPDRFVTMAEVGDAAYRRLAGKLPDDIDPTLEERDVFDPENFAWSYGCTAAMVEIDRETGLTRVVDYLVAHDCGTVINPTIVDGQIHGGAAQGIAEALYEELVYNDDGQLLTSTFLDYAIPTASEIPAFTNLHMDTPAPHMPGGMKGMGEAGTIGAPAAVANAVDDALADLGVTVTTLPVTPSRLLALIDEATEGSDR